MSDASTLESPDKRLNPTSRMDSSDIFVESVSEFHQRFKQYPIRWVICVLFAASLVAAGIGMDGFAPCTPVLVEVYEIPGWQASMVITAYILVSVPFCIPANKLIDRGLVTPVIIASVCLIGGGWLR